MAERAAALLQAVPRCGTCGRVLNVDGTCSNAIQQKGAHAPKISGK